MFLLLPSIGVKCVNVSPIEHVTSCHCNRCNKMVYIVNLWYFHFCKLYANWRENACNMQIASRMHFHKCI